MDQGSEGNLSKQRDTQFQLMVLDIIQIAHFLKMICKRNACKPLSFMCFSIIAPDLSVNGIFVLSSQNKATGPHAPETIWDIL